VARLLRNQSLKNQVTAGADQFRTGHFCKKDMKILQAIVIVILMGSLLARARENLAAPVPVELNGIANFFGVRQAFFILPQAGSDNFALSPGETKNGIKLIAIDAVANLVQIENAGQRQSLRICRAPDLTASVVGASRWPAGHTLTDLFSTNNDDVIDPNQPGNPGFGTLPPLAGVAAAQAKKSSADANGSNPVADKAASQNEKSPADGNGPNPAEQLKSHANEDWYQDSLSIEQSRQSTIQEVLAGQMTPWPLTPLTPAGTPANLISHDGMYANRRPDFGHFFMTGDLSTSR
jgi:hypothetical protein